MAIDEVAFESEKELQDWVFLNIQTFLPHNYIVSGFQIVTVSGRSGIPDGFAFNFEEREWCLVECELLQHGVWPHIAEQLTRFVVALQNPESLRRIRDRVFEYILGESLVPQIASSLETVPERLHQQLEVFIESLEPQLVVFIDETNRDLNDMVQALNISAKIFRIRKFIVNDKAEYYCPEVKVPVITSEPREGGPSLEYDIIGQLGGGTLEASVRTFKCYSLTDGSVVHIKKSRYYPESNCYWYGISTPSLSNIERFRVSHIVFIMGTFGFVKVPIAVVHEFIQDTLCSKNPDGSIRHYHCYISHGPEPELFISEDRPKYSLAAYFQAFD